MIIDCWLIISFDATSKNEVFMVKKIYEVDQSLILIRVSTRYTLIIEEPWGLLSNFFFAWKIKVLHRFGLNFRAF